MSTAKEKQTYVQTSFRISVDTQQSIRELAEAKGISQSELLRSAVSLYSHVEKTSEHLKLAMVDTQDSKDDATYFKLVSWVIE